MEAFHVLGYFFLLVGNVNNRRQRLDAVITLRTLHVLGLLSRCIDLIPHSWSRVRDGKLHHLDLLLLWRAGLICWPSHDLVLVRYLKMVHTRVGLLLLRLLLLSFHCHELHLPLFHFFKRSASPWHWTLAGMVMPVRLHRVHG